MLRILLFSAEIVQKLKFLNNSNLKRGLIMAQMKIANGGAPAKNAQKINNPVAEPRGMLFSKGIGLGFNTFITAPEGRGIKPSPRIKRIALAGAIGMGVAMFPTCDTTVGGGSGNQNNEQGPEYKEWGDENISIQDHTAPIGTTTTDHQDLIDRIKNVYTNGISLYPEDAEAAAKFKKFSSVNTILVDSDFDEIDLSAVIAAGKVEGGKLVIYFDAPGFEYATRDEDTVGKNMYVRQKLIGSLPDDAVALLNTNHRARVPGATEKEFTAKPRKPNKFWYKASSFSSFFGCEPLVRFGLAVKKSSEAHGRLSFGTATTKRVEI
jgi:hypothetical protein